MSMKVCYSNRVEILYEQLKGRLFSSSRPFTRRLIVVPSPAMKSWLMLRMAEDPELGISTGLEITYLDQVVSTLQRMAAPDVHSQEPGQGELAFRIEREIRGILREPRSAVWEPLLRYLKAEGGTLPRKGENRLIALSETLAALFLQYRGFGKRMVQDWKGENWQEALYLRLLGPLPWPEEEIDFSVYEKQDVQVHLFAKSFVPKREYAFFRKLSGAVPVHAYFLSPCEAFWSDLLSDREKSRLQQYWKNKGASETQVEELEQYLSDCNPLLANFGRLGREMAQLVEETSPQVEEAYEAPKEETLLGRLQADILMLRQPIQEEMPCDGSIQLHAACSRKREVEILYNQLLEAMETDSSITPADIIVMAPDIVEYAPYIKMLFGSGESQLAYQITDISLLSENRLAQGFLNLLDLPLSRWDTASVLELFENPLFQRKHFSGEEDFFSVRQWILDTGIRWGVDLSHRNELLKRSHCGRDMAESSEVGTWKYGIDRLLMGLAMQTSGEEREKQALPIIPYEGMSTSSGLVLGKFLSLLQSLQSDLSELKEGKKQTLRNWALYLKSLCEAYFVSETEEREELFGCIESLGETAELVDEPFSFASVRRHLKSAMTQKKVLYRDSRLHAVRFCSMLPMRAIPAKVIALLGMSEEAYPRQDRKMKMNLLLGNPKADYYPLQTDFDRYLFLEALLSSRKKVLFSYLGMSQSDGKEQAPSLLVQEVMSYLGDKNSAKIHFRHPFRSYDKQYFSEESRMRSYIPSHFQAAKAYYLHNRKPGRCFIRDFTLENPSLPQEWILDLKDLATIARNPVEAYFQKTLGMYLKSPEEKEEQRDFALSNLEGFLMRKSMVRSDPAHVRENAEKEGKLPIGPFKTLALDKVSQEAEEYRRNLQTFGVLPESLFEIEFSDLSEKPDFSDATCWRLPPLEIPLQESGRVKIIGKLSDISKEGAVYLYSGDKKDALKVWPSLLVFQALKQQYDLPIKEAALFIKGGKRKEMPFSEPISHLQSYLQYALLAMHSISPLLPEWIPDLLKEDFEAIEKKMRSVNSDNAQYFYNHQMQWVLRDNQLPDAKQLHTKWRPIADKLFSEMLEKWDAKGAKK